MFGCYQPQAQALFWHGITNPVIITALCRLALKDTGFRFTLCPWQAWTGTPEPQVWWHHILSTNDFKNKKNEKKQNLSELNPFWFAWTDPA